MKEKNNSIPKSVFWPNKTSRLVSVGLAMLINIIIIYYGILKWNNLTKDELKGMIDIGFTIVLAVVALAISVFQSNTELLERRNSDENIKKLYISYIFSIFPIILELMLGYVVAYVWQDNSQILSLYFIATAFVMTKCIKSTMASFVAFLNIRD